MPHANYSCPRDLCDGAETSGVTLFSSGGVAGHSELARIRQFRNPSLQGDSLDLLPLLNEQSTRDVCMAAEDSGTCSHLALRVSVGKGQRGVTVIGKAGFNVAGSRA